MSTDPLPYLEFPCAARADDCNDDYSFFFDEKVPLPRLLPTIDVTRLNLLALAIVRHKETRKDETEKLLHHRTLAKRMASELFPESLPPLSFVFSEQLAAEADGGLPYRIYLEDEKMKEILWQSIKVQEMGLTEEQLASTRMEMLKLVGRLLPRRYRRY